MTATPGKEFTTPVLSLNLYTININIVWWFEIFGLLYLAVWHALLSPLWVKVILKMTIDEGKETKKMLNLESWRLVIEFVSILVRGRKFKYHKIKSKSM